MIFFPKNYFSCIRNYLTILVNPIFITTKSPNPNVILREELLLQKLLGIQSRTRQAHHFHIFLSHNPLITYYCASKCHLLITANICCLATQHSARKLIKQERHIRFHRVSGYLFTKSIPTKVHACTLTLINEDLKSPRVRQGDPVDSLINAWSFWTH